MSKIRANLVVVMPVYEDRESARRLVRELRRICGASLYIVAAEDGSVRDPLRARDLEEAGVSGMILNLVRNMGHQRAIAVGLAYVAAHIDAQRVVVMDSDGEDTPDAVPELLQRLEQGDCDAVVARRRKRSESLKFGVFYVFYKLVFKLLTGREIGFGNFTALSPKAVRRLAAMQELWVHYAASLMVSRLRIDAVPTDRGRRYAGQPHMNFVSLSLHGMRSIMVFAEDVLVRVGIFSTMVASASVVLLMVAALLKLMDMATPGWFSPAIGILFLIFMQAGVLTFTTLMVSGQLRSMPPMTTAQLDQLIGSVEEAGAGASAVKAAGE